jgi:hypothetical protein
MGVKPNKRSKPSSHSAYDAEAKRFPVLWFVALFVFSRKSVHEGGVVAGVALLDATAAFQH